MGLLQPRGFGKDRKWHSEDIRCSLLGSAMSVPVVAWLLSHALVDLGLRPSPATVSECWGLPGLRNLERVEAMTGLSEFSGRLRLRSF